MPVTKKFLVDLDGVIADFAGRYTGMAHEIDPSVPIVTQFQQKAWWDLDNPEYLEPAFREAWKRAKTDPFDFYAAMKPLVTPDEIWGLNELGFQSEVYYVTARDGGAEALRGSRCFLESIGVIDPYVVIAKQKGAFMVAADVTHALEDSPRNAADIILSAPSASVFLLDRPYNEGRTPAGVKRIATVADFLAEALQK